MKRYWLVVLVGVVLLLSACAVSAATTMPAEEPRATPTNDPAETNQERLNAAIEACDLQGIMEAMAFTQTGLIPEPEASGQWQQGQAAIANCNQQRLNAAEAACDLQGIRAAMLWAQSGFMPEAQAQAQIEQGEEALASCPSLTGTWTINLWGRYRLRLPGGELDGDFERTFEVAVTQDEEILTGSGTDARQAVTGGPFSLLYAITEGVPGIPVRMEATVRDHSVTFTVVEQFPVGRSYELTGTRSRGEITGTFRSALDVYFPTDGTTVHFRVEGQFTVSVRSNGG